MNQRFARANLPVKIEEYLLDIFVDDLTAEEVLTQAEVDEVTIENTVEEIQDYIDGFHG